MKIENQVATLEQSKRLKEFGAYFIWYLELGSQWNPWGGEYVIEARKDVPIHRQGKQIPAYNAEEIAELLPDQIKSNEVYNLECDKQFGLWIVRYRNPSKNAKLGNIYFDNKSIAQALAEMLIWVKEESYI